MLGCLAANKEITRDIAERFYCRKKLILCKHFLQKSKQKKWISSLAITNRYVCMTFQFRNNLPWKTITE